MMNVDLPSSAILLCVLVACHGSGTLAASAEEAEPTARDIRFVVEEEPYFTKMPQDYQPQEDLHYAAVVRGFAPLLMSDPGKPGANPRPLDANGFSALTLIESSPSAVRLRELIKKSPVQHRFSGRLLDDYPPEIAAPGGQHLMVKEHFTKVTNLLRGVTGTQRRDLWHQFKPARDTLRSPLHEYVLLAASIEEAKQLATDFLYVHDHGFVPQLEKLTREQKAALEESRKQANEKLAEMDDKVASLTKEVEGIEELGEQALSDLKVKRTLLRVELAGIEARISTIEVKLKEVAKDPAAGQTAGLSSKLVDLKVSADIERASLEAQRKVLNELIASQGRLKELALLVQKRLRHEEPITTATQGIQRYDDVLADLEPFKLVDETVAIRPLRFRSE